jgi:hypothetical protein
MLKMYFNTLKLQEEHPDKKNAAANTAAFLLFIPTAHYP